MTPKEHLAALRGEIDATDKALLDLFGKRMTLVDQVGKAKAEGNLALSDLSRERDVVARAVENAPEDLKLDVPPFVQGLIALGKIRQHRASGTGGVVIPPARPLPENPRVGYQGVVGAWGEMGAMKLFPNDPVTAYPYFEDVFEAVSRGELDVGVLPIENTKTGAIGEVYDLLRVNGCYIVAETWIPIQHCLLAPSGVTLDDIGEVLSHPQGFSQCHRFLKGKNWTLTACRNTAAAAERCAALAAPDATTAESVDRSDSAARCAGDQLNAPDKNTAALTASTVCAAVGSRRAAEAYGLHVLVPDIMDDMQNKTRFIAIAKHPAYTAESIRVSVTFSTLNKSGALCAVLETFMLAGINLTRIESRPQGAETYRFFVDLEVGADAENLRETLTLAASHCEYFEFLGSSAK